MAAGSREGAPGRLVVETAQGRLRGSRNTAGGAAFLRIPFAAPAGPDGRFRPADPATPWSGIRDARRFGPYCPQVDQHLPPEDAHALTGIEARAGEDCLTLNVWAPRAEVSGRRPVLVWLHAGGFSLGSTAHPLTDGAALSAAQDVIVVSIGHRLGVLGYLFLDDVVEGTDSANLGLRDIVLGLEWVRDNIVAFGGDPGCVTLCGVSGGGRKIAMLMAMPLAKGLFHRAIIQSGAHPRGISRAAGSRFAAALLQSLAPGGDPMARLCRMPVAQLCARALSFALNWPAGDPEIAPGRGLWALSPVEDGLVLPTDPWRHGGPSASRDIPLLIGTTADEAALHLTRQVESHSITWSELEALCARTLGAASASILSACRQQRPHANPWQILVAVAGGDRRALALEMAEVRANGGAAPTFQYVLDWVSGRDRYGAPHMIDIPLLFGTVDETPMSATNPGRFDMSAVLQRYWCAFARSGLPLVPDLPHWPAYTLPDRQTMHLNVPPWTDRDPLAGERAAWAATRCPMPWEPGGFTGRTRPVRAPDGGALPTEENLR